MSQVVFMGPCGMYVHSIDQDKTLLYTDREEMAMRVDGINQDIWLSLIKRICNPVHEHMIIPTTPSEEVTMEMIRVEEVQVENIQSTVNINIDPYVSGAL